MKKCSRGSLSPSRTVKAQKGKKEKNIIKCFIILILSIIKSSQKKKNTIKPPIYTLF